MRISLYFLAIGFGLVSGAQSAEITLILSGSAFNGGPKFTLFADAAAIGNGEVDVEKIEGEGQPFSFLIPDDVLAQASALRVTFDNDAYKAGEGDRNLEILSATVSGHPYSASSFSIERDGSLTDRKTGRLSSGRDVAILSAPAGGWEAPRLCNAVATFTGYANGQLDVEGVEIANINELVSQATDGNCSALVEAYASVVGSKDANMAASQARANSVVQYLKGKGVRFSDMQIVPFGETEQFGSAPGDNRRVTVTLK